MASVSFDVSVSWQWQELFTLVSSTSRSPLDCLFSLSLPHRSQGMEWRRTRPVPLHPPPWRRNSQTVHLPEDGEATVDESGCACATTWRRSHRDVVDGIPRAHAWKDKSKHACDGPERKREPYTCERRIAWQGSDVEVGKRPVTVPGSLLS